MELIDVEHYGHSGLVDEAMLLRARNTDTQNYVTYAIYVAKMCGNGLYEASYSGPVWTANQVAS